MSSKSIFLIILGTFIGYLVVSCAKSATSSYYYANKQIEHGRLDFHKTLRVNEYLNAFSQEGIELEENQQVKFQFDSFWVQIF